VKSRKWEKFLAQVVVVVVILGTIIFGALGLYINGRIILPEMGLIAPGYWSWFWVMFFGLGFGMAIKWVYSIFD